MLSVLEAGCAKGGKRNRGGTQTHAYNSRALRLTRKVLVLEHTELRAEAVKGLDAVDAVEWNNLRARQRQRNEDNKAHSVREHEWLVGRMKSKENKIQALRDAESSRRKQ